MERNARLHRLQNVRDVFSECADYITMLRDDSVDGQSLQWFIKSHHLPQSDVWNTLVRNIMSAVSLIDDVEWSEIDNLSKDYSPFGLRGLLDVVQGHKSPVTKRSIDCDVFRDITEKLSGLINEYTSLRDRIARAAYECKQTNAVYNRSTPACKEAVQQLDTALGDAQLCDLILDDVVVSLCRCGVQMAFYEIYDAIGELSHNTRTNDYSDSVIGRAISALADIAPIGGAAHGHY